MTDHYRENDIEVCIRNAKEYLINARIFRQQETLIKDLADMSGSVGVRGGEKGIFRQRAKFCRRQAKAWICQIEHMNGQNYIKGGRTYPLVHRLNGKRFREWPQHKEAYSRNSIFEGVDPE